MAILAEELPSVARLDDVHILLRWCRQDQRTARIFREPALQHTPLEKDLHSGRVVAARQETHCGPRAFTRQRSDPFAQVFNTHVCKRPRAERATKVVPELFADVSVSIAIHVHSLLDP